MSLDSGSNGWGYMLEESEIPELSEDDLDHTKLKDYKEFREEYCLECDYETPHFTGVRTSEEDRSRGTLVRISYCTECDNEFYQDISRGSDKILLE